MEDRGIGSQPGATMSPAVMHRRGPGTAALGMILVVLCLTPSASFAAPLEAIAGWEGDGFDQGYGFATIGTALRATGSLSVPMRIGGSYLYYNYVDDGEEVRVSGPGAMGTIGIRASRPWGTVALSTGGEVRWERRENATSASPTGRVARGGIIAQVEGDFAWTRRLRPFLFASYSGSARYVYARGGVRWQLTNLDWSGPIAWSIGAEAIGQGNDDTHAAQGGVLLECAIVRARTSIGLRSGYKESTSSDGPRRGAYSGISLYRRF